MKSNKKKNKRIKINNINDLKEELRGEAYNLELLEEDKFKESFIKAFNINNEVFDKLYEYLKEENITYKVSDINDFINYINNITTFEDEHNKLCRKISPIKILYIDRVEYERIPSIQDDVEHILRDIEEIKESISNNISDYGKIKLQKLEEEIDREYVYAKDIELLKNMILSNNDNVKEEYDCENKTNTLFIELPNEIGYKYVKAIKGSVEYHQHIKSYIPRMKRLIENLDKYIRREYEDNIFRINQSSAIQDSVNMAVAVFNNKEFRAVSGKNDISNSCTLIPIGQEYFKSCKVNKLGKLGIGYNRVNDSEKKIIEEINRQIKNGEISDEGELILYSKWEPCPSCYYVISQFCKKYPNINFRVEYYKNYGEK